MQNTPKTVLRLARDIMDFADRRCYGLGECKWNLYKNALDEIEDCDAYIGFDEAYDTIPSNKEDRCTGDHAKHLKEAKELARDAYELAVKLEDMGVRSFN